MTLRTLPEEESLGTSRVLLVDADGEQLAKMAAILAPIAGSCDARPDLRPSLANAQSQYDVIIASYDGLLPEERHELVARFSAPKLATKLLLISSGTCQKELGDLLGRYALTNLLARNGDVNADDLVVTVQKICRSDIFGLEKYFPNSTPVAIDVTCSAEKLAVVEQAEAFATAAGIHPRLVTQFCAVADELVTNAVYNAPCDASGKSRFAHLSRADDVTLEGDERILVKFCSDGRRLGISAEDPFGSLTSERLLDYLSKCFQVGKGQVERKAGGAGLGFYHIFDAVSHLVANLSPGKRTEIIGLIETRGSYRAFVQGIKSFNLFVGCHPL
jgi:hypothetical protein